MTTIKFCGLTRPEDAAFAAELGASHIGVIFATGPRQVTADKARQIFEAAGPELQYVGVFVNSSADDVAAIAGEARLDVVQIHRDIDDGFIDALRRTYAGDIWRVIRVRDPEKAIKLTDDVPGRCNAIVYDTYVQGKAGGTGKIFNWAALAPLMDEEPRVTAVVVAGGLTPQNVGDAMTTLHPDIVDVSSGVESSPGVKDHNLMRAFAEMVHSASIV